MRLYPFLLPLVLAFLPYGHSENRSRELPRTRKKGGRVRGVVTGGNSGIGLAPLPASSRPMALTWSSSGEAVRHSFRWPRSWWRDTVRRR
jgi:hypothetical protein